MLAALYIGTLLNWWLKRSPDRLSLRQLPLLGPILLYAAAVLASAVMSIVPLQSYYAAFTDIVEQFFLFYLFVNYLRQPGFWNRVEKVLFGTTALVCLFALLEEFFQFNPLAGFFGVDDDLFRGGLLRVRATFYHPIALGCFIALVFPFVLSALIREPKGRKKTALGVLLAAMLITSFFTVSRGPWIAILLESSLFVAWWAWGNTRRLATIGFALVFVATAFAMLRTNDTFDQKVAPILNPNQFSLERTNEASSEYYRIALLKAVINRLEGPRWISASAAALFTWLMWSRIMTTPTTFSVQETVTMRSSAGNRIGGPRCMSHLAVSALTLASVQHCDGQGRLIASHCRASPPLRFIWNNLTVSMFPVLPLNLIFWSAVASRPF